MKTNKIRQLQSLLNQDEWELLNRISGRDVVSVTDIVRRSLKLLRCVDTHLQKRGAKVILREEDGKEETLMILM